MLKHNEKNMPYTEWWLEQNANRQDETIDIKGVRLFVSKDVFSPKPEITHSTSFMLDFLQDLKGKEVLDLGSGTGVIALYTALHGASRVVATDMDDKALENIALNIRNLGLEDKVSAIKSDLFEAVPEKFDIIVANLPLIGKAWNQSREMVINLYRRLFDQYAAHLKPGGSFYFSFAAFGDEAWLFEELKNRKTEYAMLSTIKFGEVWYVFKAGTLK